MPTKKIDDRFFHKVFPKDEMKYFIEKYSDDFFYKVNEENIFEVISLNDLLKEKTNELYSFNYLYFIPLSLQVYLQSNRIEDLCSNKHLLTRYQNINEKLKRFKRSFRQTQYLNIVNENIIQHLPIHFQKEYMIVLKDMANYIFNNIERPKNYDLFFNLKEIIDIISAQTIRHSFNSDINFNSFNIVYKMFATKTGRLTTESNSFPILNLSREKRKYILPTNDYFVELDFNSAELRAILSLMNIDQPQDDIYEHFSNSLGLNREQTKQTLIMWLYSKNKDPIGVQEIDDIFDKQKILDQYYNGIYVRDLYGEQYYCSEDLAINYLAQGFSAKVFFRQAIKIFNIIKKSRIKISWLLHDSIMLDVHEGGLQELTELVSEYSRTDFGNWKTNVKIGKNFGEMKKVIL